MLVIIFAVGDFDHNQLKLPFFSLKNNKNLYSF